MKYVKIKFNLPPSIIKKFEGWEKEVLELAREFGEKKLSEAKVSVEIYDNYEGITKKSMEAKKKALKKRNKIKLFFEQYAESEK